ncbi:MAG TPA: hypothetical protein VGX23_01980 [Actinocrinis sp.]|nr:hypothetical protein [Actinocrinis sp.]
MSAQSTLTPAHDATVDYSAPPPTQSRPAEVSQFLDTLDSLPSSALTACPARTAHRQRHRRGAVPAAVAAVRLLSRPVPDPAADESEE